MKKNLNLCIGLSLFSLFILASLMACDPVKENTSVESANPLPSWNEGPARQTILEFVTTAVDSTQETFIPVNKRIAVFDNDGTLWSEQPMYFQMMFALDRVNALAPEHPEWKEQKAFRAAIQHDMNSLIASGPEGLAAIMMATHTGMTSREFNNIVSGWIDTAQHPQKEMLYREMVFQPMLELMNYLRANGFQTWIISGGGTEFMRPWTEEVYGIPPQQVVGSSIRLAFEMTDTGPVIMRLPEMDFLNDKEGKPLGIEKFIGRKPVAAFGNSDGDLQMLQWTEASGPGRLMAYIHHTDDLREWAYDRESNIGKLDKGLDEALARGWLVVDMKKDWKLIYPPTP
jgi:hypothetical protein